MSTARVLIVDDENGMLRSAERVLGRDYRVVTSRSPVEAIPLAKEFKPDLAILDIQMPGMDGFELMEKLREQDHGMDFILMTGSIHELDAKLIQAIRREAFYFLQKPFDREVLQTLVERCLKLRRLDLENRSHVSRMEKELAEARAFQQSLLPPEHARIGGVTVNARYIPYAELAGDFYDYALKSDSATLLVADVSGHGASAAMLTGVVKSAFHAANAEYYEPSAVVTRVSNGIRAFSHHHFVTMICIRIRQAMLDFVNAGHPAGIVWGRDTNLRLLESTGALISPAFELDWEQHSIPVQAGDRILLLSDGITDVEGEAGTYGFDRIVGDAVNSPDNGRVLLDRIVNNVRHFSGGRPFHDDLTMVLAEL